MLDCKWGVFALDDASKLKLGADASMMAQLLYSPLAPMNAELTALLTERVRQKFDLSLSHVIVRFSLSFLLLARANHVLRAI